MPAAEGGATAAAAAAAVRSATADARAITHRSGSSFLPAFLLLPRPRREAMVSLYAWCRRSDDIVDGPGTSAERGRALAAWKEQLDLVFAGDAAAVGDPAALALLPVLARYPIPRPLFDELLAGVAMDLTISRYPTAADLDLYAYRVASVVGLMSIEVLGHRSPRARDYAVELGLALQLTNILRDVLPDLERGRIYLPLADLARHGVGEGDLLARRDSPGLRRAAAETAARARHHFARARELFPAADRATLFPAEAMGRVYRRILDRIEEGGHHVLGPRVRVPTATKVWMAACEGLKGRLAALRGAP